LIGAVPVHEPFVVERVEPTRGVPVTTGAEREAGPVPAACTTDVAFDVAELEPSLFDAVTRTRSRFPTSAPPAVYRMFVAPAIAPHPPPAELHRSH
jgi:hypothetical protein